MGRKTSFYFPVRALCVILAVGLTLIIMPVEQANSQIGKNETKAFPSNETTTSLAPPSSNVTTPIIGGQNNAPIANAGPDQIVNGSTPVILDGSNSKDANSDPLTYDWSQVTGPPVNLSRAKSANPVFAAPSNSTIPLSFVLVVNDGKEDSKPDTVTVTISPKVASALSEREHKPPRIGAAATNATSTAPLVLPAFLKYENSTYGVGLIYPEDWELYGGNASGTFTTIASIYSPYDVNGTYADLELVVDDLAGVSTNLEKYTNEQIGIYKEDKERFPDFKLIERNVAGNNTLSGNPAYSIVGTYNDPTFGAQEVKEIGTIKGDKAYVIQYYDDKSKFNRYLPILDKMVNSLTLIEPSTAEEKNKVGTTPEGFLTYSNPGAGFKMGYPSDWKKDVNGKSKWVSFTAPDVGLSLSGGLVPDLTVYHGLETLGRGLEVIAKDQIDEDKNGVKNFVLLDSGPVESNSHKILYTYDDEKYGPIKSMDIIKLSGDKWYALNYEANPNDFDQFLPAIQQMIDSFELVSNEGPSLNKNENTTKVETSKSGDLSSVDNSNTSFLSYENSKKGIKVQYPSSWTLQDDQTNSEDDILRTNIFAPKTSNGLSYVVIGYDPTNGKNISLEKYVDDSVKADKKEGIFNVESVKTNAMLGGRQAYSIILTNTADSTNRKSIEVGTLIGNKHYYILFDAEKPDYNSLLPDVQKMIDSFEIIGSK